MTRWLAIAFAISLPLTAAGSDIRGHVRSADEGEAISSAVVTLEGTDLGALTRTDGYFLVADVPPGSYNVQFSAVGYDVASREVLIVGDTTVTLDVRLTASPITLKAVQVTAQRTEFKHEINVSSLSMPHSQLQNAPVVIEDDLFRQLQLLPGVVTTSDFSAASFVRGGNADPQHTGRASE